MKFLGWLLIFMIPINLACGESLVVDPAIGEKKIYKRWEIYREGKELEKKYMLEEAILKYQESIGSEYLNNDRDAAIGRDGIIRIRIKQGEYEEALKELQWFFKIAEDKFLDKKNEIEALIQYRDLKNSQAIYRRIDYLKKKHRRHLPPKKFQSGVTDYVASQIFRLYDHIGDVGGGAEFAKGFVEMCAAGKSCKGEWVKKAWTPQDRYFQIYQAFVDDRRDGTKGRASQVIAQSDYFPW